MQIRQKLFLGFLILFACVNSVHLFSTDYNTPIDYKNVYTGARLWQKDLNPYDDALLKQEWFALSDAEGIDKIHPPGLPNNSLVYPPQALFVYYPFALFSGKAS